MIYDINGNALQTENSERPNCKIIAHRGYHVDVAQNTIDAFIASANAGFNWIEIDVRRCSDGIYVLAHDATVTLYNNGVATSVNIPNSNYESIKAYTWDSAGQYKLCTLQAVFNAVMIYDMNIICDLKNGTNADIMKLASMSGATDKVLLFYSSFQDAYNDRELLLKYDNVPIRCTPTNYNEYLTLASAISNPIYANVNASISERYQKYLNIALSCGIPILFSGCTKNNYNIWCVLANGAMANESLNITYNEFFDILNNNYNIATTITPSTNSISVSVNGSISITASSNISTAGGYVYGFIENPAVATLTQTVFGQNASFTVVGASSGNTVLHLFDGCGEIVNVSVSVS